MRVHGGREYVSLEPRARRQRLPVSKEVESFVSQYLPVDSSSVFWNRKMTFPEALKDYHGYADTILVNRRRGINKHFGMVNSGLREGDFFIVFLQTISERKQQIMAGVPRPFRHMRYTVDFLFHRVMPKLKTTRRLYFYITKGRNRAISLTECLGRLASCGFEIHDYTLIDGITCIISRKTAPPAYDTRPTYWMICTLNRVGMNGELFKVYKLRTMHPYSEYLQDFMYKRNYLQNGGKIKNDFRITRWGKKFRKLWIDELPMLWNWLRGDMKLVGVRPLSRHYYNLYPEEVRELRNKVRPGLVPPFYADLPETLEEIIESERVYLEAYFQKPLRTDLYYFCKAAYNILIKRARSN